VDWAIAHGIADPDRVAIGGGSYGGYAAVVGLAFTPDRFACGIDDAGPVDLVDLIESFPPNWRLSLGLRWYSHVGDPRVPADREDLARRSPIHRADAIRAPLLILQGANDPRVTRAHSDRLALHLHRRGVPVTYLLADKDGHSSVRDSWLPFLRATELFLARCLGGRTGSTTFHLDRRLDEMTVDLDALRAAVRWRR
jgi:dipeptidyl aminopeptidase/acylaminoacyl peptidase